MCRLPSYSPITALLLDAIETSRCSERDLTFRAYDAALGSNLAETLTRSRRVPRVHDEPSALSQMTTELRERIWRRPR
jgi:hypothetical protein